MNKKERPPFFFPTARDCNNWEGCRAFCTELNILDKCPVCGVGSLVPSMEMRIIVKGNYGR